MEFKLNICDGKKIEKTYVANDFVLTVGVAEDILNVIDIEKLSGDLDDFATFVEVLKIVKGSFNSFNPMLKGVFEELTDEEYSRADVVGVAIVIINILKYTVVQLSNAAYGKN